MRKILLIEDDEAIRMGLQFLFEQEGYVFISAANAKQTFVQLKENPDIILLDVSLPDGNGFDICREIRKEMNTPIIFLTAKDTENDVVKGFDLGADDYIVKPFRNRELLSKIRNVLKRNGKEDSVTIHGITIDALAGKVYRNNEEIMLTKLEYQILETLFSRPEKLFTREELLNNIWDAAGSFVNDNTLTVYIKRLREKIDDNDGSIIETVRDMGYRVGGTN